MPAKKPTPNPRKPGLKRVSPKDAAAFERKQERLASAAPGKAPSAVSGKPAKRGIVQQGKRERDRLTFYVSPKLGLKFRAHALSERRELSAVFEGWIEKLLGAA